MSQQTIRLECRICKDVGDHPQCLASESGYGLGGKFPYFQCQRCGCLQIKDFPVDIARYYPDNYYSFQSPPRIRGIKKLRRKIPYLNIPLLSDIAARALKNDKHKALAKLHPPRTAAILDIGCGAGEFLFELAELGFSNLTGIDPFLNEAEQKSEPVRLVKKSIADFPAYEKFDFVMLHHSLEHMPDQLDTLRKVANILTQDGTCLIRVPLASSYAWEEYGTCWAQLDAPRHYFLHSHDSMQIVANNAGLSIYESYCDSGIFQFTGSEKIRRRLAGSSDCSVFSKQELRAFKRKTLELNNDGRGDQAVFYLRLAQ